MRRHVIAWGVVSEGKRNPRSVSTGDLNREAVA